MRETKKYPRGATRKGAPCKHCGSTDKYVATRNCVNKSKKGHVRFVFTPVVKTEVLPEGTQRCRTCGDPKALEEFPLVWNTTKRISQCKVCQSISHSCSKYGITTQQYWNILEEQEHRCAICKVHEDDLTHGRNSRLSVDHNHTTGEVRGLLCPSCNTGIGYFHDNTTKLQAAIMYLSNK